jgi:uncharacterized membrane protein YgcG
MNRSFLFTIVFGVTGCATHYAYVPAPPATSVPVYGRDAAFYSLPPSSPHGELRVIAYGIEELAPGDPDDDATADAPGFSALHLRIIVSNTGQKAWTLDTREQRIELPGHGASGVAFASADREGDASQPPVIQIFFGNTRIVDEFFPLPPDMQNAEALPAFVAHTTLHTDDADPTIETTTFTRTEIGMWAAYGEDEQSDTDIYDVDQYNYEYWDDPFWFNAGFVGFAGVPHAWGGRVYSRGWNRTTGFGHNKHWNRGGGGGHGGRGGHGNSRRRNNGGGGGGGHSGGGHRK